MADFNYCRQVAIAADSLGYEGVLLPTGRSCEDSWIVAASLIEATRRLKFLVALRPGLVQPEQSARMARIARMAATLDRLSGGRLLVNLVTGGDPEELAGDGLFLPHAERYQLSREFLTLWRAVLAASHTGESIDFDGAQQKLQGGRLLYPPTARPYPPVYFGGSSEEAHELAAEQVDTYLTSGELWRHLGVSTVRASIGFAIGGGLGLLLGLLTGSQRWAETALDTSLQMLRNIPPPALIPLVILWFGIDEAAKLFLVALGVFFPVYLNPFHGIRGVDRDLIEMARAYGLSGWKLYTQVILPGATAAILVGLRFSLGFMWVLLIVAETISVQAGIGSMTMNAREFLQTDVVLVGILVCALLGQAGGCGSTGLGALMAALAFGLSNMTSVLAFKEAALRARGLSKSFGERPVLRAVNLAIAAGEFVAIVGRSGCGKSTLLRLLAGLDAPSAGHLSWPPESSTRFMFQDARLLPWARVVDNIALGLTGADARERALEALSQVGLADRANDWPAPSCMRRICCCWTSPWARWTRWPASKCRA